MIHLPIAVIALVSCKDPPASSAGPAASFDIARYVGTKYSKACRVTVCGNVTAVDCTKPDDQGGTVAFLSTRDGSTLAICGMVCIDSKRPEDVEMCRRCPEFKCGGN
jgi:hypothetical protein